MFNIISQQSTAKPGCVIELDAITDFVSITALSKICCWPNLKHHQKVFFIKMWFDKLVRNGNNNIYYKNNSDAFLKQQFVKGWIHSVARTVERLLLATHESQDFLLKRVSEESRQQCIFLTRNLNAQNERLFFLCWLPARKSTSVETDEITNNAY